MGVLKQGTPWLCSYTYEGDEFGLVILSDDADQLYAQMSAVLQDFKIDGWTPGCVKSESQLDAAMAEAEGLREPAAYQEWANRNNRKPN